MKKAGVDATYEFCSIDEKTVEYPDLSFQKDAEGTMKNDFLEVSITSKGMISRIQKA